MSTKIELLAPARDLTGGKTAINCGADAVYIGAPKYSARARAGNSVADIAGLVRYAHIYRARVYVALNTLLHDDELKDAFRLITQLYELGIDGLIIQDTGLLEYDLPPLPIIASTQMHNNTPEKAAFLEKIGFKRIILARELGLTEIKAIREQSSIELEVFVHGALCVSYSGQCWLSYASGGRSGNRGDCAQPCRKRYSLEDANGSPIVSDRYLLSIRDMDRSQRLGDLINAGATSFKIEGRLKDDTYIKNVVTAYRCALDAELSGRNLQRTSVGVTLTDIQPDLNKSFNRGYTEYLLDGRTGAVGSMDTPKMTGPFVGTVKETDPHSFTLDGTETLVNGDGIAFFTDENELTGTTINRVDKGRITPAKMEGIRPGIRIYRNHDHAFIKQLSSAQCERRIPLTITLEVLPDGLAATATDPEGVQARVMQRMEQAPAQKPEAMHATLLKQLGKLGDTKFAAEQIVINGAELYFYPVSFLNQLRRDLVAELQTQRERAFTPDKGQIIKNSEPYPATSLTYTGNVLNARARRFYQRHGVTEIQPAAESGLDMQGRRVMTTKHCIREQIGMCPKSGNKGEFKEPFYLVDESGHRYRLEFNCRDCEMGVYY